MIKEKGIFSRQAENLDRGLIAIKNNDGVYLSWRFLGDDSVKLGFNIYRNGIKINRSLIRSKTNYVDYQGGINDSYYIDVIDNNKIVDKSKEIKVLEHSYFDIPIICPHEGITPDNCTYTYGANDVSVGDLDGDGEYEIVLKWEPSNAKDSSQYGYTGNVFLDAYKLSGKFLWRIDLGINIRAGAHYTQFIVYDFDGDGYAEVVCKTADGTIDGKGNPISKINMDYRNSFGYIMRGNEYLTLFDGRTGTAIHNIRYYPDRLYSLSWFGECCSVGDRYLATVAYLNGKTPSLIMCRGYYSDTVITAYDVNEKKLVKKWTFEANRNMNFEYMMQGNHNLAVADVDADGCDEIIYGACTIDHDGKGLYTTGLMHGDAIHVGKFIPYREGFQVWGCLEFTKGAALWDAATGEILFRQKTNFDVGRAVAGNFIPGNPAAEFISAIDNYVYDEYGQIIELWSNITDGDPNFTVFWDGDLEEEVLDGIKVDKYLRGTILEAKEVKAINGSKNNCSLCADILGDWREEIIWPKIDGSALRVYLSDIPTLYRIPTLMHDIQYRCQIATQNVAYNQPAHTSFFLGSGFELPAMPNIYLCKQ